MNKVHPLKSHRISIAAFLLITFVLAACGLSSEPPIVHTLPLPTITATRPPDQGRPSERVNLTRGAQIYNDQQGCWQCHGRNGQGDGPVAANITCPMPKLADAAAYRGKSMQAWFAITTNGNSGPSTCPMPQWRNRLGEQERWDVVSFAYSLRYTAPQLARGKEIWTAQCAACHGANGAGDGSQGKAPNFTDPAYLLPRSDFDLWQSITEGIKGLDRHSYKESLSDDDRYAVVAYTRALTWESVPQLVQAQGTPTPQATAQPTAIAGAPTITVRGKITNGTAGGTVPADQKINLLIIEQTANGPREEGRYEATAATDGTYTFTDVPRRENRVYIVGTSYQGVQQFGAGDRVLASTPAELNLPITIYETTQDPTVIRVEQFILLIQPVAANTAVVRQGMRFRNVGTRVYVSSSGTDAIHSRVSLQIDLPQGAQSVEISPDYTTEYIISRRENGIPVIEGVIQVAPGETPQFEGAYTLPISGDLMIAMPNRYQIDSLRMYLPKGRPQISDARFDPGLPETLDGVEYNTYTLKSPLPPSTGLNFVVSGLGGTDSQSLANIAVLVIAIALVGGAFLAIRALNRRESAPKTSRASEGKAARLLLSLKDLDDRYTKGSQITAEEYEEKRAKIKADLMKIWGDEK